LDYLTTCTTYHQYGVGFVNYKKKVQSTCSRKW